MTTTNMYELYITKFIDNIIAMNTDAKSSNIPVSEQRIKILGHVKTLLSSISIIQYRTAIEQFTQLHLDSINNIEFDKQYQNKLDAAADADAAPDSSDDDNESDSESAFQYMCKDVDNINTFIKPSKTPVTTEIPEKYLPQHSYTQSSIKTMILRAKEAAEKTKKEKAELLGESSADTLDTQKKKKKSNKKPFDGDNKVMQQEGDLDDFIIFKNEEAEQCKCRIKLYSNKGRIYKKKVNAFTPPYYYRDKDGFYYGEQCPNKVDSPDSIYCKSHSKLALIDDGDIDLITMPPKHLEDDSNIKKIKINTKTNSEAHSEAHSLSSSIIEEHPPSSPLFTPSNSRPDSPLHDLILSPISHVDSDVDYDIQIEDNERLINYNFEGRRCLLNKATRELFDEETCEFLGCLDDEVDLC